jgi:hypothetical protein
MDNSHQFHSGSVAGSPPNMNGAIPSQIHDALSVPSYVEGHVWRDFVYSKLLPETLDVPDPVRQAAVACWERLLAGTSTYSVRYENSWKFPDGLVSQGTFLVFRSAGVDYGIASVKLGTCDEAALSYNSKSIFLISFIQGISGVNSRDLPVGASARRQMLRHIVSSVQPLISAEISWAVGLSASRWHDSLFPICFVDEIRDPQIVRAPLALISESYLDRYRPLASPVDNEEIRRLLRVGERRWEEFRSKSSDRADQFNSI